MGSEYHPRRKHGCLQLASLPQETTMQCKIEMETALHCRFGSDSSEERKMESSSCRMKKNSSWQRGLRPTAK